MGIKQRKFRRIEIIAGIFMLFSIITFFISYLLSFDFSMSEGNISDDIDFMLDNIVRLQFSAILWLTAGITNLLFLPIYLLFFHRFHKITHIINSLFILIVAFSFYAIGMLQLDIVKFASSNPMLQDKQNEYFIEIIIRIIRQIKFFYQTGVSSYGAFATILCISRYGNLKLPAFASSITVFAGPVVITLIWLNQGTIIMTTALAFMWIAMVSIGLRLVNWGLKNE